MDIYIYIFRIACALFFGFCIGLERQIRKRNAGLVTNTLVAIGACSFILISETIITASIHGLNSAATLWCSAAVGCLCGYGLWKEAMVSSIAILITNWFFKWLEHRLEKRRSEKPDE